MSLRWENNWFPLQGQAVFDHAKQQVVSVSRAPGLLDLFVIGFDNRIWSTFWNESSGWNTDWFPLPGQAVFDRDAQRIAAVSRAPGQLDLFVIGFDNRIWTTFWNDRGGWNTDWFPLPGRAVFDHLKQRVVALARTPDNLDLFVIGFDNHIWSTFWNGQGGWNADWFPLPGRAVFDRDRQHVAAVTRAAGNLDLFVIGFDNHVWSTFWSERGGWNADWFPLPGQAVFDHEVQEVAAVSRAEDKLDLFVIGFDNHVWSTYWSARGGWNADWFALPGQAVFDRQKQHVAVVSRAPGQLDLFLIGFDNHAWSISWNEAVGWNPDWFPLPGPAVFDRDAQQLAVVARATDHLDLFVIGFDNRVWSSYWGEHAADRPWAVILCRFQGEAPDAGREAPVEDFFRQAFSPGSGGLVEYWQQVSMGAVDITGSRVFDWVEIDIPRMNAGGVGRSVLIDAAIRAVQGRHEDPLSGFQSQIAVYPHNWAKDGAPADADWRDPDWAPFWIDGSADSRGKVCLTPPFNGNITAHEMGHGFGMGHDVGADLVTASDYSDPACIMSQNGGFLQAPWNVLFGPAVCVPHLVQQGWLPPGRLYADDGGWMNGGGAAVPLAPVANPEARANLGIRLRNTRADPPWDYYLECCVGSGWNRGVVGSPYLLIRRLVDIPGAGQRPAYLMALPFNQSAGAQATAVEPSGNVRFTVDVTDMPGPVVKVSAEAL